MILSYILKFIKGFVRFELTGDDVSKFLNCLMKNNIYIWNISKINNKFYINIAIKDYLQLYKLTHKYHIKCKTQDKYGLPFIINKYKKRFGIATGLIFFITFLIFMSQFIWTIEIRGNKNIDVVKLSRFVSSQNISPGKFRKNIDVRTIEKNILLKFKEISWVAINIEGSKAIININEVTPAPSNLDTGTPCNIVAAKEGIIKRVEAYNGQNVVEIGDFVKKGQILVSGILEDKSLNNTPVHARAKALATVEEIVKFCQPTTEKKIIYKDVSTNYYLNINNQNFPLNFLLLNSKNSDLKKFNSVICPKVFNISLPFNIVKSKNKQPITLSIKLTEDVAKNKILKKIKSREAKMKSQNIKILSKKIISSSMSNENYIIKIKYTTEQDIAIPQNIIFE